jgi:choline dehydrogenase-like flavoprotein
VKRGADALGWSNGYLSRNARGCVGSGVCAFGCPTGAKRHTGASYVPLAWAAGAVTWTRSRAERLVTRAGRVRAVEAQTAGWGRLRVECETVIVACGAIHTPLLLEQNGLGGGSGQLGQNLSVHPCSSVRALFDEEIDMANGVPQSLYIDEFADDGIMLEGTGGPPDYLSLTVPLAGERHRDLMLRWRNISQFGLMIHDSSRGSVRSRFGRPEIRYHLNAPDRARLDRGIQLLEQVYRAAGAEQVFLPDDLNVLAFHPLGTARANARSTRGVVDENLKLHGIDGIYVADGSVVPSALGVNPQITIMALATRLGFHLLGRA